MSHPGGAPPTHSILKKPHPASIASTPRSRSPVYTRDDSANTTTSSGIGSGTLNANSNSNSSIQANLHPAEAPITPTTPLHPSPLRAQATSLDDEAAQQTSVTFSVPAPPTATLSAGAAGNASSSPTMTTSPLPSILKTTSSQSPSRRSSLSTTGSEHAQKGPGEGEVFVPSLGEGPSPLHSALLNLPSGGGSSSSNNDASGTQSPLSAGSSIQRSGSPSSAYDRTRIVGKGGYGGRRGGPALNKNLTSSSGGLSDVDMRSGYERKVGFDTMIDADDTPNGYFTFCLQVKSRGYKRTKNTRTFMCACDDNGYSERALEWLMESLVSDGDEIVALRVLEGDPDEIDQDAAREEARELMASIVELNDEYGDRSISIVVEFVAGRVTDTIMALIYMYRPDSITVGTRGRTVNTLQKMLGSSFIGSCSRDILNVSPVPVVIVRPEAKVKKHLAKRANDPKRRSYHDLVALSKEDHLPLSIGSRKKHLSVPGQSKA